MKTSSETFLAELFQNMEELRHKPLDMVQYIYKNQVEALRDITPDPKHYDRAKGSFWWYRVYWKLLALNELKRRGEWP